MLLKIVPVSIYFVHEREDAITGSVPTEDRTEPLSPNKNDWYGSLGVDYLRNDIP